MIIVTTIIINNNNNDSNYIMIWYDVMWYDDDDNDDNDDNNGDDNDNNDNKRCVVRCVTFYTYVGLELPAILWIENIYIYMFLNIFNTLLFQKQMTWCWRHFQIFISETNYAASRVSSVQLCAQQMSYGSFPIFSQWFQHTALIITF